MSSVTLGDVTCSPCTRCSVLSPGSGVNDFEVSILARFYSVVVPIRP